ncbi:MAG: GumC family protein [Gemmatimonadota bacterium]
MDEKLPVERDSRVYGPFIGIDSFAPDLPTVRSIEAKGDEDEFGLEHLWGILRRQVWFILAAFCLVIGAAAVYTWRQVPVWQASTLIRIEEERSRIGGQAALFPQLLGESQLETEMRVVATAPILSRVVETLDLNFQVLEPADIARRHLFSEFAFERSTRGVTYKVSRLGENRYQLESVGPADFTFRRSFRSGDRLVVPDGFFVLAPESQLREAGIEPPVHLTVRTIEFDVAVSALRNGLTITRPDREASLFQLSYQGTDRYLVRNLVNEVAAAFIAQRRSIQKTEARSTVAFLQEQTGQIQTQLEAAENALQEFREEEQVVAPESEAEEQVRRLAEFQAERYRLAAERDALRNLLWNIRSSTGARPDYLRLVAFPTFLTNETIHNLVRSLTTAEQRRTALRERWTENHPGVVALDLQIEQLEERLGAIGRNYLQSLDDQIASSDAVLTRFGSDLENIPGIEIQYARLERQTLLLANLHSLLQQHLREAEISEAVEDPSVRVVEPAVLPRTPVRPKPKRNFVLSAILGLMLGGGLAYAREHMDKSIHSDDDVYRALGFPVLSRVPHLPLAGEKSPRRGRLVAGRQGSLLAESYRTLRTNVWFFRPGAGNLGAREMLVTSPGARDGKTITAGNLAVTFAQQGRRTLLVDADLRRSCLHQVFAVDRKPGLSEFLGGQIGFEDLVLPTDVENLFLVPAGIGPPNPAELIGSPLMDYVIQRARDSYETIIFDSPPVLAVTDATILGRKLYGVILVVRADCTHRKAAQDALEQLTQVGAQVLGVVVNDAKANGRYGYRYSYYYDYYAKDQEQAQGRDLKHLIPFS